MEVSPGDPTDRLLLDRSADIARTVESLVAKNRVDALHTLAVALDAEADDLRTRLNRAEVALQHVAFTLAETPGDAYAETLLRLLPNRPFLYNRLRSLASALGSNQTPDTLLALFTRTLQSNEYMQAVGEYYHIELLSLLLHQMILRGMSVVETPGARLLHNKMRGRRHPLAWLPLTLTDLEDELAIYLPPDEERVPFPLPPLGQSAAQPLVEAPPLLQPMLPLDLPPADAPVPATRETTRSYNAERIRVAVANWYNMEARTFAVEPAVTAHTVSAKLLLALGLECLERARDDDVRLSGTTPNRILARLFAVASSGGPHEGYEGAYGRLYAWQSLAALAGAAPDDTFEAVCAQVQGCTWFHVEAETEWFYRVGWDVGIVALRPDGASLAVLAATATD